MKIHNLLISLTLILCTQTLFTQSNRAFHYQAVARDNAGAAISNSPVNLRFQIRANSPSGNLVYQETHSPSTNQLGLINLDIGKGLVELGNFNNIPWNEDDYYLIVELNGAPLDTTLFESVPYAKVATDMQLNHLRDVSDLPPFNDQVLAWDGTAWVARDEKSYAGGTGISILGNVINNDAPDLAVSLTGSGSTSISGTYPNFTINSTDEVDDADADASNELQSLSLNGNTLSLSQGGGSVNVSPDQVVSLNGQGATTVSGTYPNFSISSTDQVDDADADSNNEIQNLSLSGSTLSLSLGGGSVNLSPIK